MSAQEQRMMMEHWIRLKRSLDARNLERGELGRLRTYRKRQVYRSTE